MAVTIFFCYAREDEALLNRLKTHLKPLQRLGLIDVWYDRDISAGAEWEPEIVKRLDAAQIILLLVSPDFMDSDYAYGIEMKRALERHEKGKARVIPIILCPVYWHEGPLGKLKALPKDGKPVTHPDWHRSDIALYDVIKGIREVVRQLIDEQVPSSLVTAPIDVEKLALVHTLTSHTSPVACVALSTDGETLVSGSYDKTIKIWKLSTGQEIRTLKGHEGEIMGVALSADGETLVSGSSDNMIKIWKLSTGQEIRTLISHTSPVACVALSTDGETLVSGSWDNTIKIWKLSTGQEIRTLKGHEEDIRSVALSADGETLVSGSSDKTIKIWKLSTGQEIRTLKGHERSVASVALSADGETLVSGSYDNMIKIWKLSTGQEIRTLKGHTNEVLSVALSADGETLVSGSYDKTIKIWRA